MPETAQGKEILPPWEAGLSEQDERRSLSYGALLKTLEDLFRDRRWSSAGDHVQAGGRWPFLGIAEEVAQDQFVFLGTRGAGAEVFKALKADAGDSQSETSQSFSEAGNLVFHEEEFAALTGPAIPECALDSTAKSAGVSADELSEQLLVVNARQDKPRVRELVILAEDTAFTRAQSQRVFPRLLHLAEEYRDSGDPDDQPMVWGALRTGGSMLQAQEANWLLPLLQPGHVIETSLVAVKMLGRVFEAQPPADIDQYPELTDEVGKMVDSVLNHYAIAASQSAAMADLAIYALVAMASSASLRVMRVVRDLHCEWFARQTGRRLRELEQRWTNRPSSVSPRPLELLKRALAELAG